MAEKLHRIPPVNDLKELSDTLQDFHFSLCQNLVLRLQPATGANTGRIEIVVDDAKVESGVPTLREYESTLPETELAGKIAATEDSDRVVLRSYGNILMGGVGKVVALFDPAPVPQPPVPQGGPNGTITSDHWLDTAAREPIGQGTEFKPLFLVIHYTEGFSARSSMDDWRKKNNGIMAHVVVDRDGTIFQCRPFNQTCQHAGASRLRHPETGRLFDGLNSFSLGIEIANSGDGGDDNIHKSLKTHFPQAELMTASHRNAGIPGSNAAGHLRTKWEVYPAAQIESVFRLARLLMAKYRLADITGHDCIAFERKTDPGPAFPMARLREDNGLAGLPPVWSRTGEKLDA